MIDKTKIDGQKLINMMLDDVCGNLNKWWSRVEFVENYMPRFPREDTKPTKVSVKCGENFLRHIGFGRYIWDMHYGKDSEFGTQENALLCLMNAPVPPWLLSAELWKNN
jgi:hypothetical protein